jgi:alanyl-tRNA synthetase
MRELIPIVSEPIEGKGGGRPAFVEIAGDDPHNLSTAVDNARDFLSDKMSRPILD